MTLERMFVEGLYHVSAYELCGIFPSFHVLKLIIKLVKRHVVGTGLTRVFRLAFNSNWSEIRHVTGGEGDPIPET